jgi:hypothetical protein
MAADPGDANAGPSTEVVQSMATLSVASGKRRHRSFDENDGDDSRIRVRRRFGWDRETQVSSVPTGSSAPRGMITRFVHKRNRSNPHAVDAPPSKRGRGFRPK